MDDLKKKIIRDMKYYHAGQWIAPSIAIWNLDGASGIMALRELINEGIVEEIFMGGINFVRYVPKMPPVLKQVESESE